MPCDIKIGVKGRTPLTIIKGVEDITFDELVDHILTLPKSERTKLAALIRAAKSLTITNEDIENHLFVSNITIDDIRNKYPELSELYPDINITDNSTLMFCTRMLINGSNYYGRVLDSSGKEMFIINGKYGAEHLFKYLQARKKIETSEITEEVTDLAKHYNLEPKLMLIEFLNNKQLFKPFKEGSKTVLPVKILNEFIYDIIEESNETDLLLAISAIKKKTTNKFDVRVSVLDLYKTLELFNNNLISELEFSNLSEEDLEQYLKRLFISDPKYSRAKIKSITGGEIKRTELKAETKPVPFKALEEAWENIRLEMKSMGIEMLSLRTTLKNAPEQVKQLERKLSHLPGLNIDTSNGKLSVTYMQEAEIIEKTAPKIVTLYFPWQTLGEIYGFSYNTKLLFSPVTKEEGLSLTGMYNGAYIYKYFTGTNTHYAVSDNIISPYSESKSFDNLDKAKSEIDSWKNKRTLLDYGKIGIKLGRVGTFPKGRVGLIVTSLDLTLPNVEVSKLPRQISSILKGTLSNFHKLFEYVDNIQLINTPEKAAAFTLLLYDKIRGIKLSDNLKDFIPTEMSSEIIETIELAKTKSYIIDDIKNNETYLKELKHNGTDIKLDGTFDDGENASIVSIGVMLQAISYFNDTFGIEIHTLSQDEIEQFANEHSVSVNNIRAFVYNGEIYINSANANLSDLFHEISHIFLGVLKTKYPDSYEKLMKHYQKNKEYKRMFNSVDSMYSDFSMLDKIEEAVVNLIAKNMFKKQSLLKEFNGEEFLEDFRMIMTKFPEILKSMKENTGLEFSTVMKDLLMDMEGIKLNMKISDLVRTLIKKELIKEFDC